MCASLEVARSRVQKLQLSEANLWCVLAGRGAARLPRQVTLNGVIYSDKVRSLADLHDDEDAAAAEALAQGGRPGYCGDRYFKAAAGGHFCDKFDRPSR